MTLFMGVRREAPEVRVGINSQLGGEYGEPVFGGGGFGLLAPGALQHDHGDEAVRTECEYQLKLIEIVLLPTFAKILSGPDKNLPEKIPSFEKVRVSIALGKY